MRRRADGKGVLRGVGGGGPFLPASSSDLQAGRQKSISVAVLALGLRELDGQKEREERKKAHSQTSQTGALARSSPRPLTRPVLGRSSSRAQLDI